MSSAPRLVVRRFQPDDADAIDRLNARLRAGGSTYEVFGEAPGESGPDRGVPRERLFVASDGAEIRGAVYLREAHLQVRGATQVVGWVKYPVAESLVDKAFATVPAALVMALLREQPLLVAVGLGGHEGPLAKLLTAFRWTGEIVPSFVLPLNVARVVRALPHLRRSPARRMMAAAAYWSGAAALGSLVQPWRIRQAARTQAAGVHASPVPSFGTWADELWAAQAAAYPVGIRRDAAWLNWMYPQGTTGLQRLRMHAAGRTIGWAVIQTMDLRNDAARSPYGPLIFGALHDMFAAPTDAARVVAAATEALVDAGADIAVAQHNVRPWQQAIRDVGFHPAPPSFACYRSAAVSRLLGDVPMSDWYITRGDDGVFAA